RHLRPRLVVAGILGAALTLIGRLASWLWDLPTGPAIVSAFGVATAAVGVFYGFKRLSSRDAARLACALIAAIGMLLVTFPRADQPWLDALEKIAPPVQTIFLTEFERGER